MGAKFKWKVNVKFALNFKIDIEGKLCCKVEVMGRVPQLNNKIKSYSNSKGVLLNS